MPVIGSALAKPFPVAISQAASSLSGFSSSSARRASTSPKTGASWLSARTAPRSLSSARRARTASRSRSAAAASISLPSMGSASSSGWSRATAAILRRSEVARMRTARLSAPAIAPILAATPAILPPVNAQPRPSGLVSARNRAPWVRQAAVRARGIAARVARPVRAAVAWADASCTRMPTSTRSRAAARNASPAASSAWSRPAPGAGPGGEAEVTGAPAGSWRRGAVWGPQGCCGARRRPASWWPR
ncbi:hypothetical protein [Nonomuraea recticatena]|uniref:hypothetical protein n=1 Tax=Nonomuraea recticatena TaxID=46178 RepID=UPI003607D640